MTAKVKQPAYLYYFSHHPAGQNQDELGAYHAAEIRYVFNNYQDDVKADREIGDIMSDYWVSFAKNGDPNVKGRPEWKPYLADDRHYMEFNGTLKTAATPHKNILPGVWEFYERYNAGNRP